MDANSYQQAALLFATAKVKENAMAYSMGGVGGEAGEYIDVVKKYLFRDVPPPDSADRAREELGDLQWGIALACMAWGFTLEEVMRENLFKLQARHGAPKVGP